MFEVLASSTSKAKHSALSVPCAKSAAQSRRCLGRWFGRWLGDVLAMCWAMAGDVSGDAQRQSAAGRECFPDQLTSPAKWNLGIRRRNSPRATFSSSRARFDPRQRWMPRPRSRGGSLCGRCAPDLARERPPGRDSRPETTAAPSAPATACSRRVASPSATTRAIVTGA